MPSDGLRIPSAPSSFALCLRLRETLDFTGNLINILGLLAEAHTPIIHAGVNAETAVPEAENTVMVRERCQKLGGPVMT